MAEEKMFNCEIASAPRPQTGNPFFTSLPSTMYPNMIYPNSSAEAEHGDRVIFASSSIFTSDLVEYFPVTLA